jgi:hypothetical protein
MKPYQNPARPRSGHYIGQKFCLHPRFRGLLLPVRGHRQEQGVKAGKGMCKKETFSLFDELRKIAMVNATSHKIRKEQ